VLGIIDDKSRFLIATEFITNKKARTCARAFEKTIQKYGKPKFITTDNGKEFVGRPFTKLLKKHSIKAWRSRPRTPQHNGKIERVWRTIEKIRGKDKSAEGFLTAAELYNQKFKRQAHKMTPYQARQNGLKLKTDYSSENIHDHVVYESPKKK
jgi:transposase InsO family protein